MKKLKGEKSDHTHQIDLDSFSKGYQMRPLELTNFGSQLLEAFQLLPSTTVSDINPVNGSQISSFSEKQTKPLPWTLSTGSCGSTSRELEEKRKSNLLNPNSVPDLPIDHLGANDSVSSDSIVSAYSISSDALNNSSDHSDVDK